MKPEFPVRLLRIHHNPMSPQDRQEAFPSLVPFVLLPSLSAAISHKRGQRGIQLILVDGLQDIVGNAQLDRSLGIGEVPIAAYHDKSAIGVCLPHGPNHIQSIHPWHLDVRDDDIDMLSLHMFHHIGPVVIFRRERKAQLFPVDEILQQVSDMQFIIRDYDLKHDTKPPT